MSASRKLRYTGQLRIELPEGGRLIKPGDITPELPAHIYKGLKARSDFEPVRQRKSAEMESENKKEE